MTAAKLTAAQVAVLRELAKDGAWAFCVDVGNGSRWVLATNLEKCTTQIRALLNTDAVVKSGSHWKPKVHITDAGRAYLAALDAAQGGAE